MSDIYDETQELHSVRYMSEKLSHHYTQQFFNSTKKLDPDERRRMSRLVTEWPGNDIVAQIIFDAIKLINKLDINTKQVKW